MDHAFDTTTKAGTATGTLITIIAFISHHDLLRTAVLACVGAVVSFCATLLLKRVFLQKKKR